MILDEWRKRLKRFDDDWELQEPLFAHFSEEELEGDVEAAITFRTQAGTVDRVQIVLLDANEEVLVELDYSIFELDMLPLTDFLQEALGPPDEEAHDAAR